MSSSDFILGPQPASDRHRELWLQRAAGFIFFEDVRGYAAGRLDPTLDEAARTAALKAIDDAVYGLMMIFDGVTGNLGNSEYTIYLQTKVCLTKKDAGGGEIVDLLTYRKATACAWATMGGLTAILAQIQLRFPPHSNDQHRGSPPCRGRGQEFSRLAAGPALRHQTIELGSFGGGLGLGDCVEQILRHLAGAVDAAILAHEPVVFSRRDQHQVVPAVFGGADGFAGAGTAGMEAEALGKLGGTYAGARVAHCRYPFVADDAQHPLDVDLAGRCSIAQSHLGAPPAPGYL